MPVYRKGKKWRVVVRSQGQRHDWVIAGSKGDAKEFLATKSLELARRAPSSDRVAPTFSAYCLERYAVDAKNRVGAQTWSNRRYQIATLVEYFGETRLDRIDVAAIERFMAWRAETEHGAVTINNDLKVLLVVLNHAAAHGVALTVPKVKKLKEKGRRRVKFWTREQLFWLFDACRRESADILDLVTFVANTGVRKTEAIRLVWEGVDLKHGVAWIEPTDEEEHGVDWTPKGNVAREVPIGATVREMLRRLKAERDALPRGERSPFVFVAPRTGQPWAFWPQHAFDRARNNALPLETGEAHDAGAKGHAGDVADCGECGKQRLQGGAHTLRHTFAAHFLERRPDLYLLSKILGHASEKTTAIYAHLLPGRVSGVADLIDFSPSDANEKPTLRAAGDVGDAE